MRTPRPNVIVRPYFCGIVRSAAFLCSLFLNLQPTSVGISKHIAQIDNFIGCHRIGTGLQQGLKSVVNHLGIDFAQFVFFYSGTPDKSRIGFGCLTIPIAPAASPCSPQFRRALSRIGTMAQLIGATNIPQVLNGQRQTLLPP
jgi:hypothetical protein